MRNTSGGFISLTFSFWYFLQLIQSPTTWVWPLWEKRVLVQARYICRLSPFQIQQDNGKRPGWLPVSEHSELQTPPSNSQPFHKLAKRLRWVSRECSRTQTTWCNRIHTTFLTLHLYKFTILQIKWLYNYASAFSKINIYQLNDIYT